MNPTAPTQPWNTGALPGAAEQEFSNALNNNFLVAIDVLPNVQFYMKTIDMPIISVPQANISTNVADYSLQGDKIDYGDLVLTFFIDEYWWSYEEIFRWLRTQVNPDVPIDSNGQFFGQATLTILNNNKNAFGSFKYRDIFPVALSSPTMSTQFEAQVLSCQATFRYTEVVWARDISASGVSPFSSQTTSVLHNLPAD